MRFFSATGFECVHSFLWGIVLRIWFRFLGIAGQCMDRATVLSGSTVCGAHDSPSDGSSIGNPQELWNLGAASTIA